MLKEKVRVNEASERTSTEARNPTDSPILFFLVEVETCDTHTAVLKVRVQLLVLVFIL
jgi:hypothetical protein